ncbi:MAG: nucleotidyltransferase family protein, partial [Anaerolineales bacterium]
MSMDKRSEVQHLLCSIVGWNRPASAFPEGLSKDVWMAILDLAALQRLIPLVHARLAKMDPMPALPSGVEELLRNSYHRSLLVNTRRFHKMVEVLKALVENQVLVIPLKGAYLAPVVYGNLGVRSNVDFDLLVRQDDLARTVDILERMGYVPAKPISIDVHLGTFRHLPAFSKEDHLDLQIHWNIANPGGPFDVDADGLWARAHMHTIDGVEVPCLSPEDLLLHLSLHASYMHRFYQGLRMLCDISEVLRHFQKEMDWEKVRHLAGEWGVERCVCVSLALIRDLLGADVPEAELSGLVSEDIDKEHLSWASQLVFADASLFNPSHAKLARLSSESGAGGGLRRLLRSAFPSRQALAKMYPAHPTSPRILLYYPVRWKDLASRYAGLMWRLARGERATTSATEHARRTNA